VLPSERQILEVLSQMFISSIPRSLPAGYTYSFDTAPSPNHFLLSGSKEWAKWYERERDEA
jgi:hypothetical protein